MSIELESASDKEYRISSRGICKIRELTLYEAFKILCFLHPKVQKRAMIFRYNRIIGYIDTETKSVKLMTSIKDFEREQMEQDAGMFEDFLNRVNNVGI